MKLLDALWAGSIFARLASSGCAGTGCFAILGLLTLFAYIAYNGPVM